MSNTGITVPGTADFIIVKLDYSRKLILPIEEGVALICAYGKAIQIKSEYNKPDCLAPLEPLEISFMAQEELNGMILMRAVDPDDNT